MVERVLVCVAHGDDETLGAGGTIAKHTAAGDQVSIVVMADGISSRGFSAEKAKERQMQCRAACKALGTEDVWLHQFRDNQMDGVTLLNVAQYVERHVERFKPTIVYTHWLCDLNIDHRKTSDAVMVACRPLPGSTIKKILFMEVPESTQWAGPGHLIFAPTYYVDIGTSGLIAKQEAMRCYVDELREPPHPRSAHGIQTHSAWRGMQVGVEYAEAFIVAREIA